MDDYPGPSSSSAPPDPSPPLRAEEGEDEEEEQGGRWVLVPAGEVDGAGDPKVSHWDDLQQELARLCSLSAALASAGDRKARLASRLHSALQARRAFLQQDNELAELRKQLQHLSDRVGDLNTRTKKASEDVEDRREKLCVKIRTLTVAGKTLAAARSKLQEANNLMLGGNGHGRLKHLEHKLRRRQQYMIAQVANVYPVRHLDDEQSPPVKSRGLTSSISRTTSSGSSAESVSPNGSRNIPLAILGLQLSKLSVKKSGYFSDKTELQKSSSVLGYAAHAVSLIASYLDVPLRYPFHFGGSKSYVLDHAPSVDVSSMTSAASSFPPSTSTSVRTVEFPLFLDGQETTKSAYAVFLLNKDIEQLLNYIGAETLGPRHVLANLKQLTAIIQSRHYVSN